MHHWTGVNVDGGHIKLLQWDIVDYTIEVRVLCALAEEFLIEI